MSDREIIGRHSKSFALAARLLPRQARIRAEALYAWCRAADDRIDHARNQADAEAALRDLKAQVEAVYAGRVPTTPAGSALHRAVAACRIPQEYPLELIAGLEMDVRGTRYATADELLLYCHRVAGVVGLMMCHALGVMDDAALRHADHLGIAMQLTNIARDVAEDWSRGRLYLPAEWFSQVPTMGEMLRDEVAAPAVRRCLGLAERYYRSGDAGLHYLSPRCHLAILTASRVYRAIGDEITAREFKPSVGRVVVSRRRKWAIVARSAIDSLAAIASQQELVRSPLAFRAFRMLQD